MDSLLIISECRSALAECKTLDDVLAIRDKMEAARQLMKVRGESLEAQNQAAEIKIRAERMLGDSLSANPSIKRGRKRLHDATISLTDLGIEKTQSHRWQQMASVPNAQFEKYVATTIDKGNELTSTAVYKLGRAAQNCVTMPTPKIEGVTDSLESLIAAGKKFGTIYADPPWRYGNTSTRANVEGLYDGTMTTAEVCAMPVRDLVADDAHLHLWTTNAFLREAFDVITAWGFEYRSVFVWVKPQMGIGNYWRVSHEFLLLGIRGDAKRFNERNEMSWREIDRGEHSAKPDEIRGIIERVSTGPYLEMFGRRPIADWTVFGNQIEARLFSA